MRSAVRMPPNDQGYMVRSHDRNRLLAQLDWSAVLDDLKIPPGNGLEALKDDRKGQHSIRINKQWRVCFVWTRDGAANVEIVDYH